MILFPIPGWSSTQPSFTSYSSRFPGASGPSGNYLSPRNHAGYSRAGAQGGYSNNYQPSKYGLGSEPSLNTASSSNFRNLPPEENALRSENGYSDRVYGFIGREFDLEPYRSHSHRGTDYSSDSGRGQASRRMTDYSSDSGTSYRRHNKKKSNDFDLEIPSPDTSRSQSRSQNDDIMFSSPVKSNVQISDYYKFNNSQVTDDVDGHQGRESHLMDYQNLSRSEPNLDNFPERFAKTNRNGEEQESENSPRNNDDSQENIQENGAADDEDEIRANFTSPSMYHGDIADLTLAQRNNLPVPRNKASDLTEWQQKQKSGPSIDHNRLSLKPPSPRNPYKHVSTSKLMLC